MARPDLTQLRARAADELREFLATAAYLFVVFGLLLLWKLALLRAEGIHLAQWGIAITKALLVAKFILLGKAFHAGERFKDRPLIWPTVHKSLVFVAIVVALDAAEEIIVGLFKGRALLASLAQIGGGSLAQFATMLPLLFVIFLPYFAVRTLGQYLGDSTLRRWFLHGLDREAIAFADAIAKHHDGPRQDQR